MRTAAPSAAQPEVARLLDEVRAARFAHGVRCPRCGHDRTQRWGSFSGRQRYRCVGCTRTFSDLTATPAAYSKKLLLWTDYGQCMADGASVRRAARRLRIHPCTAFRWRHVLLAALRERDDERLAGWIELLATVFPFSEKGRRRGPAAAATSARALRVAKVLAACDRRGRTLTAVAGVATTARIYTHELERSLHARVQGGDAQLVAAGGPFAPASILARRAGWAYHDARRAAARPRSLAHLRTAEAYVHRLRDWLERFRGVATRYLPNYLVWHRALDARWRRRVQAELLRWPMMGGAPA